MRVAIAEDSGFFREALQLQLASQGVEVVIVAATGEDLLAQVAHTPVDAAILDIRMPPTGTDEGMRAAEQLAARWPHLGILVLSQYDEIAFAERLFATGTAHRGYLHKDRVDNAAAVRDALERVCDGDAVIDEVIVTRLLQRRLHERERSANPLATLTPQEKLVLQQMAEGRTNKGIANTLHLSEKTVEAYVSRIFGKLSLDGEPRSNRRVLAVIAWLRNTPPEAKTTDAGRKQVM